MAEVLQTPAPSGADVVGRHRGLVRRTALISGLTAVSRVLGYARELLTAVLFGASSPIYDAFVTAWRVPNLFRRLLGEGAVSTALQTALTETDGKLGDAEGRRLFWDVMRLALGILIGLCTLLMGVVALMPDSMPLTGWAWLGPAPETLRELLVRVMPYVVFICLAGLVGGALAVRGRFLGASASAAVMNLAAISTLLVIAWTYGWTGAGPEDGPGGSARHLGMARLLSWGLVVSGALQLLVMVPDLGRAGLFGPVSKRALAGLRTARSVLVSSVPLALGAAVYQINVTIDGYMAWIFLVEGGATTYYFANRIQQLPLALVATAATNAVFPALTALAHTGQRGEVRRLHDQTHLAICFIALPATAGLIALAHPITTVLLEHGEFSAAGAARTALGLQVLALALVPAGAAGLLGRTYFALGDFKAPVRVSAWLLLLNLTLNLVFLVGLGMDIEGLALATAIASWTNVLVLRAGLARLLPRPPRDAGGGVAFRSRLARLCLASALCGAAGWSVHRLLGGDPRSAPALFGGIAAGLGAYLGACQGLGVEEWKALRARLSRGAARR